MLVLTVPVMCSRIDKFCFKKLKLKITGYTAGSFYIVEKPTRKNKEIIFKYNQDDPKHQQLFKQYEPQKIKITYNYIKQNQIYFIFNLKVYIDDRLQHLITFVSKKT